LDHAYVADRTTHLSFFDGHQFQGTVTSLNLVPEPSSAACVIAGLLAMASRRRA
jgi:hypothetical protein